MQLTHGIVIFFKNLQLNMAFYTLAFFGLAVVLGLNLIFRRDCKQFVHTVQCKDDFSCIKDKDIDYVDLCNAIEEQSNKKTTALETDVVMPKPTPANGIDDYLKRFGRIPDKEIC